LRRTKICGPYADPPERESLSFPFVAEYEAAAVGYEVRTQVRTADARAKDASNATQCNARTAERAEQIDAVQRPKNLACRARKWPTLGSKPV